MNVYKVYLKEGIGMISSFGKEWLVKGIDEEHALSELRQQFSNLLIRNGQIEFIAEEEEYKIAQIKKIN